jgi:hypothetical protein
LWSVSGYYFNVYLDGVRPSMWSEFLATDPEVRVRFPALPDFLRSLEWGPLSLLSTIEELLGRKSSGSGLEIREYRNIDPSL